MGYKIDSDILFDLIHSELKTFLSPLSCLIPDDNKRRHFEMAIGGIIKKAGELTDAEASNSEKPKYTELSPAEVALELSPVDMDIAFNWQSTISRLKQAGYVICRKENR